MPGDYRAIGTEPFWDLTIGRDLVFTDRGNNVSVAEPTPPVRSGFAGETYPGRRLRVNIVHAPCSDGMSDRTYPDTVNVTVDGRAYRGCGAEAAFFARVGEDGRDRARSASMTCPTPIGGSSRSTASRCRSSGYYLNFMTATACRAGSAATRSAAGYRVTGKHAHDAGADR